MIELTTKSSGRIGVLAKAGQELKTPFVLHYTKVSVNRHACIAFLAGELMTENSIDKGRKYSAHHARGV